MMHIHIYLLSFTPTLTNCPIELVSGKHLVLVTDPEKGDDYAFDNPGFKGELTHRSYEFS